MISRGEYVRLLNEPMARNLTTAEIDLAVSLAHRYMGRAVLTAWRDWLRDHPGGYMRDFQPWFEEHAAEHDSDTTPKPQAAEPEQNDLFATVRAAVRIPDRGGSSS